MDRYNNLLRQVPQMRLVDKVANMAPNSEMAKFRKKIKDMTQGGSSSVKAPKERSVKLKDVAMTRGGRRGSSGRSLLNI